MHLRQRSQSENFHHLFYAPTIMSFQMVLQVLLVTNISWLGNFNVLLQLIELGLQAVSFEDKRGYEIFNYPLRKSNNQS